MPKISILAALACLAASSALLSEENNLAPARIKINGAVIDVTFSEGKVDLPAAQVVAWITTAAEAVAKYFGRFPVPNPRIQVHPTEGRSGIFRGTTYGSRGGFTRISIGQHTTQRELDDDWMMTHELVHMAFPDIEGDDREHHWIEEGMATYIEPIARCQIGKLTPEQVWGEMAKYMPQGLPGEGDQGLDNTHTWGRTYWGGALYWMMADVQIRQQSGNKKGLQHAMRAIVSGGGTIVHEWPIEKVLQVGDQATGTTVLADLYNRMKGTPVPIDLEDLWAKLGVQVLNGAVKFNDGAPLADIRKSIADSPGHMRPTKLPKAPVALRWLGMRFPVVGAVRTDHGPAAIRTWRTHSCEHKAGRKRRSHKFELDTQKCVRHDHGPAGPPKAMKTPNGKSSWQAKAPG